MVTILHICQAILKLLRQNLAQHQLNGQALADLKRSVDGLVAASQQQGAALLGIKAVVDQIEQAVEMERGEPVSLELTLGQPIPQ